MKNLYTENYKALMKETEKVTNNEKIFCTRGQEELVLLKRPHYQNDLQIKCNCYQNSNGIFHRNVKK